jgi:F-type H+-transporting ATPase subunit a
MQEHSTSVLKSPEFPNIIGLIAELNEHSAFGQFLHLWESIIYALIVIALLTFFAFHASRNRKLLPSGLQNAAEFLVSFVDDFVCSVLGPKGRKYTPFIGTLFLYILALNSIGLIPFFKSPTIELSATFALALVVFFYTIFIALTELGPLGFLDHLMGQPRGIMAMTLIMPIFMFVVEVISFLVRPISLSLRLRSNIFGDDTILALFASQGINGFLWLLPNFLLVVITSVIQAAVFSILTLVYFSLAMKHEDGH